MPAPTAGLPQFPPLQTGPVTCTSRLLWRPGSRSRVHARSIFRALNQGPARGGGSSEPVNPPSRLRRSPRGRGLQEAIPSFPLPGPRPRRDPALRRGPALSRAPPPVGRWAGPARGCPRRSLINRNRHSRPGRAPPAERGGLGLPPSPGPAPGDLRLHERALRFGRIGDTRLPRPLLGLGKMLWFRSQHEAPSAAGGRRLWGRAPRRLRAWRSLGRRQLASSGA